MKSLTQFILESANYDSNSPEVKEISEKLAQYEKVFKIIAAKDQTEESVDDNEIVDIYIKDAKVRKGISKNIGYNISKESYFAIYKGKDTYDLTLWYDCYSQDLYHENFDFTYDKKCKTIDDIIQIILDCINANGKLL